MLTCFFILRSLQSLISITYFNGSMILYVRNFNLSSTLHKAIRLFPIFLCNSIIFNLLNSSVQFPFLWKITMCTRNGTAPKSHCRYVEPSAVRQSQSIQFNDAEDILGESGMAAIAKSMASFRER